MLILERLLFVTAALQLAPQHQRYYMCMVDLRGIFLLENALDSLDFAAAGAALKCIPIAPICFPVRILCKKSSFC